MTINKLTLLLIVFLLINCTSKNEKSIDEKITANQIINKFIEVTGGYENFKNVKTIIKQGHYIEPAYNMVLKAKIQKRRPNFRIIGDLLINGFEEGYNGTAWEYHKEEGLILSEGEAKEAILIGSYFDYPFINAENKGHKIRYNGYKYLGGVKTYDIEVKINVMDSDYITNFYFDINSYLLVGQRKVMPIHAVGEDVEIIVQYSDYRNVNGVLFPYSHIERNEKTAKFLNASIWSEIIINQDIPLSTFDPPNKKTN